MGLGQLERVREEIDGYVPWPVLDPALKIADSPDTDAGQFGKLFLGESAFPSVASQDLSKSLWRRIIRCPCHPTLPIHHGADRFADSAADFAWSPPATWLIVRGAPVPFNVVPAPNLSYRSGKETQQMTGVPTLGHVAIVTHDPARTAAFYRDLLGMEVTLQGALPQLGDFAFLSGQPQTEFAELAFVTNPRARHIALRVESLAALKAVYAEVKRRNITLPSPPLNHQVSLSLYLQDPDGNMAEVYWATGEKAGDPMAEPVDLELSDAELLALVQRREAVRQGGRS